MPGQLKWGLLSVGSKMRVTVTIRRKTKLPLKGGERRSLASLLKDYEPDLVIEDVTDRRVSVEATEGQVRSLRERFAKTLMFSQEMSVKPF